MESANLVAFDDTPIGVHCATGAGRNVERTPNPEVLQHGSAVGVSRFGNIIESEAYQRRTIAHEKWLSVKVPGNPPYDSCTQRRKHDSSDDLLVGANKLLVLLVACSLSSERIFRKPAAAL